MRFDGVGRAVGDRVLETMGRVASRVQESRSLPADVLESDDAYLVVFDAPGVAQTDVQVRYAEGGVEVRIDRFRAFHDGFEMRVPGRGMVLDGRAALPERADVDPAAASATLRDDGTLAVTVPKVEPGEPTDAAADDATPIDDSAEIDGSLSP
jgi:HSP20 family protein